MMRRYRYVILNPFVGLSSEPIFCPRADPALFSLTTRQTFLDFGVNVFQIGTN